MSISRLKTWAAVLRTDLNRTTARGQMTWEAAGTMGLRIGTLTVTLVASIFYARILGPQDYGLYAYTIAWQALAAVPAGLGLGEYLLRELSKIHEPGVRRYFLAWADRRTVIGALVAALALITFGWLAPLPAGASMLFTLAAFLPLLNNLANLRQSILRASGHTLASQWPSLLLAPMLMLIGILGWWLIEQRLSAAVLMISMLVATGISLAISQLIQGRLVAVDNSVSALSKVSLKAALPFMWLAALTLINSRIDLIMLGSIKGSSDAGIYAVATRGADLVTFVLTAVNIVIAPRIASYFHQGDMARLQRLLSASARRGFLVTLPLALGLSAAGPWLLSHVFGTEYAPGAIALSILACAQLVNVAAGSVGLILNMTGHEHITARSVGFAAVLNFSLSLLLVPPLGIEGAAIASGVSLVTWNLLLWRSVRHYLGLHPSAFGV